MNHSNYLAKHFARCLPFQDAEKFYEQPVYDLDVPNFSPIFGLQLAIWQLRNKDLQVKYPLDSLDGRVGFLAWCVFNGRSEYQSLKDLDIFWKSIQLPAVIPTTEWSGGISRFLQLTIIARPDIGIDASLSTIEAQLYAQAWFWCFGGWKEVEFTAADIPTWQRNFLINDGDLVKTRFAKILYSQREDLQSAFNLTSEVGLSNFRNWLMQHALHETALPLLLQSPPSCWPVSLPCEKLESFNKGTKSAFGINLIGYAFGELGIGEDVRMAAKACEAVGIPFTIINFEPGSNISQNDRSLEKYVSEHAKYYVNLICLTALESLRFYLERGKNLLSGHYNIGYWPWELQNWPAAWSHCFHLIDEMWASSRHIQQAAEKSSSFTPVKYMPMAVHTDNKATVSRSDFDLPEDKVLFVFSFDGNSFIERKNPLAIIKAFSDAFPKNIENVGLVIKCMRPSEENLDWQHIKKVAIEDERIYILDKTLDKSEVLGLYSVCDCFVSLHRAEGFGRGIAESLLLNLKVIASDYGGNVDFCRRAGAYMIPCSIRPLAEEEYVEGKDNFWGEPDIAAASVAMQKVLNDCLKKESCNNLVHERLMKELFSFEAVGARYFERLRAIVYIN